MNPGFFLKLITILIYIIIKPSKGSEERMNLVVVGSGILDLDNDNHTMYCEFAEDSPCIFIDPSGNKLFVNGDIVTDEESNIVAGIYGYTGGRPGTCGITLKPILDSHLGDFVCMGHVELGDVEMGHVELGDEELEQTREGRLPVAGYINLRTGGLVPNVRLPRHLVPWKYSIDIIPRLEPDILVTEGHVLLWSNCSKSSTNISLHYEDMYILPESVKAWRCDAPESCENVAVDRLGFDYERKFLIVSAALDCREGGGVLLGVGFRGNLRKDGKGFYSGSYAGRDGETKLFAATQFEAAGARRAFPCMDEPAMKATFKVSLGRQGHTNALSNMPKSSSDPIPGLDGYFRDHFQESVPMSTYLVAFLVSDLASVKSGKTRVWARPEAIEANLGNYALEMGNKILVFYAELFGVAYPLPKMDLVALPGKGGAMENWGLVLFGEEALLYDSLEVSNTALWRVTSVLAHELAHQWFGNLVTLSWWNELWLNEGFAQFVSYLGVEHVVPELASDQGAWHIFIRDELQEVLDLDAYNTTHPINIPIQDPDEIGKVFDSISYSKGAAVIRMMKFFLGNGTFLRGIHNYLEDLEFSNAVQDDLWQHLTEAGHEDGTLDKDLTTKVIMDTWTMQAGYPVLVAERTYGRLSNLRVRQLKFSWSGAENVEYEGWFIPYTFTSIDNDQARCLVDQTTRYTWLPPAGVDGYYGWQSTCDDSPFIFNIDQLGFYRVLYDERNWKLIGNLLNTNHTVISPINRAQIMDDAMAMAKANLLSYNIALDLTLYMRAETNYIPLHTIINNFQYMANVLVYSDSYTNFITYQRQLLSPLFIGIDLAPDIGMLDSFYSVDLISWACHIGLDNCVAQVIEKFVDWVSQGGPSPFHPDVEETAFCTAVGYGGEDLWNFLFQIVFYSDDVNQKTNSLRGLACSNQSWLLIKLLSLILDPTAGISNSDAYYLARAVASNVAGRFVAFEWIINNYDSIQIASDYTVSGVLEGFAQHGSSQMDLELLNWFRSQYGPSRTLNNSINTVMANIQWVNNNSQVVMEWMQQHTE